MRVVRRMAGTGSIFLRTRQSHGKAERRWVATCRMPDGSRPSTACPHQHRARDRHPCTEAQANLTQLLRIRADQAPLDVRTLTVGAFLRRWSLRLTNLAPATIRHHEMIVRVHLEPAFRDRLLTSLRASDVDAYLSRRDLDAQTLRHHRSTLRRGLRDAVRDGYISQNPAALSDVPRMRKAQRRYLNAAEARRLMSETQDERLWPLWALLVTTGLRLSEALGLAWSDVDLANGTLRVDHQLARQRGQWVRSLPKTDKSRRTVILIPAAIEALREQRRRQDEERGDYPRPLDLLVFTTRDGRPIHGPNVLPPFYRALRKAGLPKVTLHDLRHSCATILLGVGVPLPVIADILGHSSIRVTADLYAHIVPELRRDAAGKLAEALS